jgi:hypothetical protein
MIQITIFLEEPWSENADFTGEDFYEVIFLEIVGWPLRF